MDMEYLEFAILLKFYVHFEKENAWQTLIFNF